MITVVSNSSSESALELSILFPKNIKAYLLFDCKEFLGGEKRQLLHRVFLHHHVCTPLISNLKILATLDTEKQKDDDEIYTHTHF